MTIVWHPSISVILHWGIHVDIGDYRNGAAISEFIEYSSSVLQLLFILYLLDFMSFLSSDIGCASRLYEGGTERDMLSATYSGLCTKGDLIFKRLPDLQCQLFHQ